MLFRLYANTCIFFLYIVYYFYISNHREARRLFGLINNYVSLCMCCSQKQSQLPKINHQCQHKISMKSKK